MQKNVTIFGTGYVGLVTGVCLANLGHKVTCVDVNSEKIDQLNKGVVPIYEPGLEELIKKNHKNLFFTTESAEPIKSSDIIFIAVGTPQGSDGSADLQFVRSVAQTIGSEITDFKVIVIKSTVPVGTGDEIEKIIAQNYSGNFALLSNPEFLKEGTAIDDFNCPDRIVIGINNSLGTRLNQKALDTMNSLYQKLDCPTLITDRRSSELIKYASNAFLATKISFINSIAAVAESSGADIDDIARGIGLDKRIGPHFLKAGVGYGGSCFPKDVQALIHIARAHQAPTNLLESVEIVNVYQKELAVKKLKSKIDLKDKVVGLWGLSFKPDTDDLREAPSLTIIKQLLKEGAKVQAWDPISEKACADLYPNVYYCPSPYEAIENADAAILITEWSEVKKIDLKKVKSLMKTPLIIDGRNILSKQLAKDEGIEYMGIGR